MGEVALLLLIMTSLLKFGKYVVKLNADDIAKVSKASKDGSTYIDNNGRMRLIKNNHIVVNEIQNDHHVLKDLKTFEVLKDYTQEVKDIEYAKSKNKAISENKKIFCIDFDMHKKDKIKGMRYQNMITGEIYVIRQIGKFHIPFYMNMKGELISLVDKNWKHHQMIDKSINVNISEEVKKHIKEYKDKPLWNKTLNHLWNEWLDLQYCGKEFGKDEV